MKTKAEKTLDLITCNECREPTEERILQAMEEHAIDFAMYLEKGLNDTYIVDYYRSMYKNWNKNK